MTEQPEVEKDPRTDGVADSGQHELPPPSQEEIDAGVEHDRKVQAQQIADPQTPYHRNPADDEYDE